MKYTKQYFIEKFENGPKLGVGLSNNCALAVCGVKEGNSDEGYILTDEAIALIKLFTGKAKIKTAYPVFSVNDNFDGDHSHLGSTPTERIINKLKSLP